MTSLQGTTHPRWFGGVGALVALIASIGLFAGIDGFRSDNLEVGIGGVGAFAVGIGALIVAGTLLKQLVHVDESGIRIGKRGKVLTEIHWSEPHDLYMRATAIGGDGGVPLTATVSVRAAGGRRIDVAHVNLPKGAANAGGIVPLIVRYSTDANWPRLEARLRAGEDVEFGSVRMNRARVKIGLLEQPLGPGLSVRVENGQLRVQAAGKWFESRVWVRNVANYPCFLRALTRG